jgi:hypothetical protein
MVSPPATGAAPKLLDRLLAPRVVFSALIGILVIAILFTPNAVSDDSRGSLSTLAYDRGGARGWYEGARRHGWRVTRSTERFRGVMDTAAVYVVLSPDVEPTAAEVGALLAAVRAGAGLIVSPFPGSPLADSLHVHRGPMEPFGYKIVSGTFTPAEPLASDSVSSVADSGATADSSGGVVDSTQVADSESAEDEEDTTSYSIDTSEVLGTRQQASEAVQRRMMLPKEVAAYDNKVRFALTTRRALRPDTVVFLGVIGTENLSVRKRPAVLGMPLGRGRVIAVADPWIVRNQLLDEDELVILPERMLEWVAPTPAARVVFDEYHHGMGRHASVIGAMKRALSETPVGRVALQLMLAALVLLIALGTRPIPPRPRMRVERRSPFEHVGALARAYSQVGATRLAARRLVRGIRRRHGAGNRVEDDAAFLRRLAVRHPTLRPNVERLVGATQTALPPREFTLLADDIDTIERTIST